jgi:hypothetical protein
MRGVSVVVCLGSLAVGASAPAAPSAGRFVPGRGFERNDGQLAAPVRYAADGEGYRLFLTEHEVVFALPGGARVAQRLVGAAPGRTEGEHERGRSHYLRGPRSAWRVDVPRYARVVSRGVYPGIDRVFHADRPRLEYDFVVAPGADPGRIGLAFEGSVPRLASDGSLVLETAAGTLREPAPIAYQERADGAREPVEVAFRMDGQVVRLEPGDYDRTRALVIDPVIEYSTYLGGSDWDETAGVATDAAGNAYVVGGTCSTDFPVQGPVLLATGGCDAFVAKFDPAGGLVYSTYLGGTSYDEAAAIAVDASGQAYVTGLTFSADFPTQGGAQPVYGGGGDAYMTVLDPSGSAIVSSTFLGGSRRDAGWTIAVDGLGLAHVAGQTESTNFPTARALQRRSGGQLDAFVTKTDGGRLWYSTYLGGSGNEAADGIAVDRAGRAWVAGGTLSPNFPVTPSPYQVASAGGLDAYVTAIDAGGRLAYSSYLGGSGDEAASTLALDAQGRAVIVGVTRSQDFPTASAVQGRNAGGADAFVTRLDASGTGLDFSTYLGGTATDAAYGVGVAPSGTISVAGTTMSADFPTLSPLQAFGGGGSDAFATLLDASGTGFKHSTFLGGSKDDIGRGLAVGPSDEAYVIGYTHSGDFPVHRAFQPVHANPGQADTFITRIVP